MDTDDAVSLIENVRVRLRTLIEVDQVLDYLTTVDTEQKEQIRIVLKNEGSFKAAELLIDTVLKTKYQVGWFRVFVDALAAGGCQYAADYVENKPPSPSVVEENDCCVRLIELLSPSLLEMKTSDVCLACVTEGILTTQDEGIIKAKIENTSERHGARELLWRIVRFRPGWFSTFLKVLQDTEHFDLRRDLTGESIVDNLKVPVTEEKGDGPCLLIDGTKPPEGAVVMEEEATRGKSSAVPVDDTLTRSLTQSPLDESVQAGFKHKDDLHEEKEVTNSLDLYVSGGSDIPVAAAAPEKNEIILRDYQMDVARPALEGKNIIICLPTGSGKTRVAVYITREHLDVRKRDKRPGKVVVLVNKVPLVEQHYTTEFWKFLKHKYKVERVSGDSQLKISFTEIVKKNDIIICTAQILENYLDRANNGDDEGIRLTDLTLIVIDECHHTQKGGVYNHIMMRYLKQKHKNVRLEKEGKEPVPIPQILGLTASPGVDGANKMEKAEEHILRICANLDAFEIMTSLGSNKMEPYKSISTIEKRNVDPFGDLLKGIMNDIHAHAEMNPTCDLGTQTYEQWAVQKEQNAAREENHKVRVCAEHLRQYNEGLQLSYTIRMCDAFSFLDKYHKEEMKKKAAPEGDQPIQTTDTERFLFTLFKDKKTELQKLARKPEYENNSLSKLRTIILQEFTSREKARGIIFTKTRRSAIALSQWIQENSKFEEVGVMVCHVIGGGNQSVVKPMTAAEQRDVLNKFRNGEVNLLIATTVAEEGLDIAECNFVIRYGLVTNETAMIQARGRGRAEDSSYTLIEVEGSGVTERESVNEYREKMMSKAIDKVKNMERVEYEKKIKECQIQSILEERVRTVKKIKKRIRQECPSKVKFSCRGCSKPVCSGEDIQIIENMHRVNVCVRFSELYTLRENTSLQERLLDYETNGVVACKDCGTSWGSMMLYRGIDCPCLNIKNFVVKLNEKTKNYNKWSELAIQFKAFDYTEHAHLVAQSSEDEETM